MSEPTQLGQQWKIGFGGAAYTGYMPTDVEVKPTGEEEIIPDENNATATVITYNKGKELSMTFLIKSTGSIEPPAKNTLVDLKGPGDAQDVTYRCTEASTKHTRGVTELTLSLIREDSMAATYDA